MADIYKTTDNFTVFYYKKITYIRQSQPVYAHLQQRWFISQLYNNSNNAF